MKSSHPPVRPVTGEFEARMLLSDLWSSNISAEEQHAEETSMMSEYIARLERQWGDLGKQLGELPGWPLRLYEEVKGFLGK
jgi:hypothetical protein